jgi:N-acetylmuramoyl-L-alanine amidase
MITKLNYFVHLALLFTIFKFSLTFAQLINGKYVINEKTSHYYTQTDIKNSSGADFSDVVIVIDPGHGGKDDGALHEGIAEKRIVLSIAKSLKSKLESAIPGVNVILTRENDVFVPLYKRAKIANNHNAALFISLHCNSYSEDNSVHGAEIHVLGAESPGNKINTALRENASIFLESDYQNNYEWHDPDSPEAHIFLSTFQNIFLDESIEIASKLTKSNQGKEIFKQRGIKQSGLLVLRNAAMPSMLIEMGYLSNSNDRALLSSSGGQNLTASWISNVLMEHFVIERKGFAANR